MRKLTFLLLLSIPSFAQTQKGNFSFGTKGINFNHNEEIVQFRELSIEPSIGYFISNNLEIGLAINSQITWFRDKGSDERWFNSSSTAFLAFITKYFARGKFQPFISASGGVAKSSIGYLGDNGGRVGLNIGVQYCVSKNIALGFHSGIISGSTTNFNTGLNFTIYTASKKEKK